MRNCKVQVYLEDDVYEELQRVAGSRFSISEVAGFYLRAAVLAARPRKVVSHSSRRRAAVAKAIKG